MVYLILIAHSGLRVAVSPHRVIQVIFEVMRLDVSILNDQEVMI